MSRFYAFLLAFLMLVWAASGVYNAVETHYRKAEANRRFCTLSKTFVTFIDDAIAGVPKVAAEADSTAYNRGYALDVALVHSLVEESPCSFTYTIPPNLLS